MDLCPQLASKSAQSLTLSHFQDNKRSTMIHLLGMSAQGHMWLPGTETTYDLNPPLSQPPPAPSCPGLLVSTWL